MRILAVTMTARHLDATTDAATDAASRVATTVRLDPELHRRLRVHVAEHGTTVQEWIEAKIVAGLTAEGAR